MGAARFALYNALKPIGNGGRIDDERAELKSACEMLLNKKQLTLTIQLKSINRTEEKLGNVFDLALSTSTMARKPSDEPMKEVEDEAGNSLGKLEKMLEGQKPERPSNPYFTRED